MISSYLVWKQWRIWLLEMAERCGWNNNAIFYCNLFNFILDTLVLVQVSSVRKHKTL